MQKSVFTDEYKAFLALLVAARKSKGLTQKELALRLHKPQSFVSKYEHHERRLDVIEFVQIAQALEVDPCQIVREIDTQMRQSVNE